MIASPQSSDATGDESGWVIDASVALPLFIQGPLSEAAAAVFDRLTDDPPARLCVPDLFYIEVTNVLWKYVRWQGLDPALAQDFVAQLGRLYLQPTPTADLMEDALSLAVDHTISAYDACYVALAQRQGLPLLSADTKLVNAIGDATLVQQLA